MMDDTRNTDITESFEEESVCHHCGNTPCEWDGFGKDLLQKTGMMHFRETRNGADVVVDESGHLVPNSSMRRAMYRIFTYLKFGHLGRGVRIPIPECVLQKIRAIYPANDGQYMGFHETAEENKRDL